MVRFSPNTLVYMLVWQMALLVWCFILSWLSLCSEPCDGEVFPSVGDIRPGSVPFETRPLQQAGRGFSALNARRTPLSWHMVYIPNELRSHIAKRSASTS